MATTKKPLRPLKSDPTKTSTIRLRCLRDLRSRFMRLKAALRKLIVEEDAFGLKEKKSPLALNLRLERELDLESLSQGVIVYNDRWRFETNDQKLKSFKTWFRQQVETNVLEVDSHTGKPWLAEYVESTYKKGVLKSYADVNKAALGSSKIKYEGGKEQFLRDSFAQPEAVSKIRLIYTRSFDQLEGITSKMGGDMSRVLADGLANGLAPDEVAKNLVDTIDISQSRAETLARTEMIHAHAEGQLDSFEKLGVEDVGVEAEFLTAGDDLVCPICAELEGQTYSTEDARGVIPVHPN